MHVEIPPFHVAGFKNDFRRDVHNRFQINKL